MCGVEGEIERVGKVWSGGRNGEGREGVEWREKWRG